MDSKILPHEFTPSLTFTKTCGHTVQGTRIVLGCIRPKNHPIHDVIMIAAY